MSLAKVIVDCGKHLLDTRNLVNVWGLKVVTRELNYSSVHPGDHWNNNPYWVGGYRLCPALYYSDNKEGRSGHHHNVKISEPKD